MVNSIIKITSDCIIIIILCLCHVTAFHEVKENLQSYLLVYYKYTCTNYPPRGIFSKKHIFLLNTHVLYTQPGSTIIITAHKMLRKLKAFSNSL